jgi:Glycosyltransferase family 87
MQTRMSSSAHRVINQILSLPLITWVLLGFFLTFLLFFVIPVFLDPFLTIQFKPYFPVLTPIGNDFRSIVGASSTWLHTGVAPAILYPVLTLLFFALFAFFSLETGYKILLLIILICFIFSTLAVPLWFNRTKNLSAFHMLILVTGLSSYGLLFELERGQWNLIAFTFCLAGIYLFHRQPKYRWLAYVLFSISVQLKLYPAIFVFVLIDDWSDWRNNLKRIVGLGLINILALFILGINPILSSIGSISTLKSSHTGRAFNHSITSSTLFLLSSGVLPQKRIIAWLLANSWVPQLFILIIFFICCLIIIWQQYKRGSKGFSAHIFLACSIGALIIPSISFDYKLSFFPACVALSYPNILDLGKNSKRFSIVLLTLIFSISYSSMLYSYTNKPIIAQNDLPALFILLMICTVLSWMRSTNSEDDLSEPPPSDSLGR